MVSMVLAPELLVSDRMLQTQGLTKCARRNPADMACLIQRVRNIDYRLADILPPPVRLAVAGPPPYSRRRTS